VVHDNHLETARHRWALGGAFDTKIKANDQLAKVSEALTLIKTYDRRRYNRLLHDVRKVWVTTLFGAIGQYQMKSQACRLDRRFVAESSPARIATTIVHEATHARLIRFGYAESVRTRIEKDCVRSEFAFADKIPERDEIRKWLDSFSAIEPASYTAEAFQDRNLDGRLATIRELEGPDWMRRFVERRILAQKARVLRNRPPTQSQQ
jgi:hypothetical protein